MRRRQRVKIATHYGKTCCPLCMRPAYKYLATGFPYVLCFGVPLVCCPTHGASLMRRGLDKFRTDPLGNICEIEKPTR